MDWMMNTSSPARFRRSSTSPRRKRADRAFAQGHLHGFTNGLRQQGLELPLKIFTIRVGGDRIPDPARPPRRAPAVGSCDVTVTDPRAARLILESRKNVPS